MKVKFTEQLKHARDGQIYPTTYEPGEHDVPDDVADFAVRHGFAVIDDAPVATPKAKGRKS